MREVYDYAGKADLNKQGLLKSKKKIEGNHAFFKDNLNNNISKKRQNIKQCMGFFS